MDTQEYLSRKERRLLQRQGQYGAQQSGSYRRVLIWGGSLIVVAGLAWLVIRAANNVQLPTQNGSLAVPVTASDHMTGPASASITLVEYSDYQCPACGSFYPIIKQLLAEPSLKSKVKFVYRNFPLTQLHANAQLAAQAAEAASLQGKFWEMHDILFENQVKWSDMSGTGARQQFIAYATTLKLDIPRFSADIDSSAVKDKIKTDADGGIAAGVNATPTFYVNGLKMPQPSSYDQFKSYVTNGSILWQCPHSVP